MPYTVAIQEYDGSYYLNVFKDGKRVYSNGGFSRKYAKKVAAEWIKKDKAAQVVDRFVWDEELQELVPLTNSS